MSCHPTIGMITYFETPSGEWWAAIDHIAMTRTVNVGGARCAASLSVAVAITLRDALGFPATAYGESVIAPGFDVESEPCGLTDPPSTFDYAVAYP